MVRLLATGAGHHSLWTEVFKNFLKLFYLVFLSGTLPSSFAWDKFVKVRSSFSQWALSMTTARTRDLLILNQALYSHKAIPLFLVVLYDVNSCYPWFVYTHHNRRGFSLEVGKVKLMKKRIDIHTSITQLSVQIGFLTTTSPTRSLTKGTAFNTIHMYKLKNERLSGSTIKVKPTP